MPSRPFRFGVTAPTPDAGTDWIERARIVALSWDGLAVPAIAAKTGRHENTVRR